MSETLRAVGRGEQVRVTLRGRPVADIVPVGPSASDADLRKLVAEGRLVRPARALPKVAPSPVEGRASASLLVLAEREAQL